VSNEVEDLGRLVAEVLATLEETILDDLATTP
jgi:hypothetical protein